MGGDRDDEQLDLGTAGASARREHERRKAMREQRVREEHPRLGGVLLALRDAPASERAWARGAAGERLLAESLARRLSPGVRVLHDRRIPRSRANIDHIAVAASGVWVIDAKRYRGRVAVTAPLVGRPALRIADRDKSKLADGLAKQVELVRATTAEIDPQAPVHGVLCFVDGELPLLRTLTFKGFSLLHPKRLAKRINADGPLTAECIAAVVTALATRFPSA